MHSGLDSRKRRLALIVLCLSVLMIVLDGTVVNVALPSIREDLRFTDSSLVWVVNAYMLTFGGSLLLGGRLGDLYGQRKLFLIGVALFTLASLACGLANTPSRLIAARAVQGLGGAVVMAVALSLIMSMFTEPAERAKAMGVYGFVCAGGGSIGLLLGGMLTSMLSWHWVFLINLPIGVAVCALCLSLLPTTRATAVAGELDFWGALTVTTSLMIAIYGIVNGNEIGWVSTQVLGLLACAVGLLILFLIIEARATHPLIPLGIFRLRNLTISTMVRVLWAAGACAWSFSGVLYLQFVLGYGPMEVALAFLPTNILSAAFALGLSARIVTRFGIRRPLGVGLLMVAIGLALLARAPIDGDFMTDIFPSMVLLGIGAGVAFNPLLLAGMSDVAPNDSGIASGIVNTASLMGGALGLAVLATFSAARTNNLLASGASLPVALTGGYHVAFALGAICASAAALIGAAFLSTKIEAPYAILSIRATQRVD
jgi:EmrB/QacA subfamily drug resistance transporter